MTPHRESIALEIECPELLSDLRTGDSVSVDGCCLTAETLLPTGFTAYASPETVRKTSLRARAAGSRVNLERALTLQKRLGGHLVSGHVDATGTFRSARAVDQSWEVRIAAPPDILRLCIPKGSIAVDGISLTLVDLTPEEFSLWIIPETWTRTTLRDRRPGDPVNLETDLVGKYVFRFLEAASSGAGPAADARLEQLLQGWGERPAR